MQVGDVVNLKVYLINLKQLLLASLVVKILQKRLEKKSKDPFFFFLKVIIQVPIKSDEQLIRSCGQYKTIGQVIGAPIVWPKTFIGMTMGKVCFILRPYPTKKHSIHTLPYYPIKMSGYVRVLPTGVYGPLGQLYPLKTCD